MSNHRFIQLQKQIFSLFDQNKLEDALATVDQAHSEYPERMGKTSYWKACIYSLQGKTGEAIAELQYALEQGVWWHPQMLIRDPDFKALQELEAFQKILDQCNDKYEKSIQSAKVELDVYGNPQADVTIFSLHMRSMNTKDFAQFWFDQESLNKYYFAFPQSSQVFSSNGYCWDNPEVTKSDILAAYQLLQEKNEQMANKLIIAGGSQGGKVALELFLENLIPEASGFVLVVPSISNLEPIENLLKRNSRKNLRGCIVTGDQDYCYHKILELIPLLQAYDIDCKLIVKEGMGHYFPDDFTDLVKGAVEYIMD